MNYLHSSGDYPPNYDVRDYAGDWAYVPQKDISLGRLSIVSVITNLWRGGVLENELQNVITSNRTLYKERYNLMGKAANIVMKLELPTSVAHEVIRLLEWISLDFFSYLDHLLSNEFFPFQGRIGDIIKNIRWDMHGGIDAVQSFRNMKLPNYLYNYFLSCLYCLEDDVVELWEHVSPTDRLIFTLKRINKRGFDFYATYLIYYWTCYVRKRRFPVHSLQDPIGLFGLIEDGRVELKMTAVSIHCNNIHAFKYFWRKLDLRERFLAASILCDRYVIDNIHTSDNFFDPVKNSVDIMLFVLSQLSNGAGYSITSRCLPQMMVNFWQCWQVHHVLLPMFENYAGMMHEDDYKQMFEMLAIMKSSKYSPRNGMLYKIWLASPPRLKNLIPEEERQHLFSDNHSSSDSSSEEDS